MKILILTFTFVVFCLFNNTFAINNTKIVKDIPMALEYSEYEDFDINKLPDGKFYKISNDYKYVLNNKQELAVITEDKYISYIVFNGIMYDLYNDVGDSGPRSDASVYLVRQNNKFYLFVDKMHFNDVRYYRLYSLSNGKIEIVEEEYGRIDFVGYDYIIGYTDMGMIGYQQCEFKKVFKNGKLELEGEYKVVEDETFHPFWVYYTLVKDLEYEEYDDKKNNYKERVLKAGTKIRAISTDAKTYITIEVEDGKKGKVKVDKVDEEFGRDFIVNWQLFMDYYFLDGSKRDLEVYRFVPAY